MVRDRFNYPAEAVGFYRGFDTELADHEREVIRTTEDSKTPQRVVPLTYWKERIEAAGFLAARP
jgi:hypothetical protein